MGTQDYSLQAISHTQYTSQFQGTYLFTCFRYTLGSAISRTAQQHSTNLVTSQKEVTDLRESSKKAKKKAESCSTEIPTSWCIRTGQGTLHMKTYSQERASNSLINEKILRGKQL